MTREAKPLEWSSDSHTNAWPHRYRAITPIAEYTVTGSEGQENWRWFRNGFPCGPDWLIERSKEGAMDAAFAHHVATLRACFKDDEA